MAEVGCSWGGTRLVTHDLNPYFNLLNLELCKECSRTVWATSGCNRGAAVEADTIREQHRSGRNRGAEVEVDAIWEKQLKWMQSWSSSQSGRNRGAVEAGAMG